MDDPRKVILRPIISERSVDMINDNRRYTFEVAKQASKIEVRQAVEEIFDVHVTKVNTMSVKPKPKRQRYAKGLTRSWKKAIVSLQEGESIEAFGV
jgi:large subunit ribosomal protein L23